ncbi:hypothetical protein [Ferrovibrio terrae]|uniref:hypothetical protein n=1 Tax=Ferrovibrio terrae TaxID=2594003 RepID=UPI003137B701
MSCPAIFGDYALPTKLGSSFYHAQLNGVVTIVAPGTNVNGIRLGTGTALAVTDAVVVLFAATSAPSGYSDTSKQIAYQLGGVRGTHIDLVIPAGLGLYAATGMNIQFCLNYDIL